MFKNLQGLLAFFLLSATGSSLSWAKDEGWTINAKFDHIEVGSKALGSGAFWGLAGQSEITGENKLNGKAAKIWVKKGQTGYGKWGGDWNFRQPAYRGDTVWFSVHTYFPQDFDHYSYGEGGRLKFLRIQTKSSENAHQGYNDLLINTKGSSSPFAWIFEGEQKWSWVGRPEDLIEKNSWENYQMAITFDSVSKSEGGMAEIRVWKNGVLLKHITDRKTLEDPGSFAMRALLFTYWNGGGPQDQSMYVDEIVITTKIPEWRDADGYPIVPFYTDLCRLPSDV